MPKLMFNGHPADTPKPYDYAQDRDHQRVADRDEGIEPGFIRKAVPVLAIAAGAAAVLAAGTLIEGGAKSVAGDIRGIFHGARVSRELDKPIGTVKEELKDGELSPSDVVVVKVGEPISTYGEAARLAGGDHSINPVAFTIERQQGDTLQSGDEVVLPAGSINAPQAPDHEVK